MIAGYEVPHTHIHVWPSNSLHDFNLDSVNNHPDQDEMDQAARKIRHGLREAGFGEFVPPTSHRRLAAGLIGQLP